MIHSPTKTKDLTDPSGVIKRDARLAYDDRLPRMDGYCILRCHKTWLAGKSAKVMGNGDPTHSECNRNIEHKGPMDFAVYSRSFTFFDILSVILG